MDARADWAPPPDDEYQRDHPDWDNPANDDANANDASEWPEPIDLFGGNLVGAPKLKPDHLPDALADFVFDTAERLGVDPASVALCAVVACCSVASDDWALQPKALDFTWTENARLWGAIVDDPSGKKTPVLKACTKPLDKLETEAREQHQADMKSYKRRLAEWKKAGEDPDAEPTRPRMTRYMIESTTIEALSDVLRDDREAKYKLPAKKVLVRQDELSEWISNMDRYRAGGRGGGDRGAYLRLFNGGPYGIDRVLKGSCYVPNMSACLLGGIQPEPIRRIANDASDDGLIQRFLFCKPGEAPRGVDRAPNRKAIERYERLFPALAGLTPGTSRDSGAGARPQHVVLHRDARHYKDEIDQLVAAVQALPDVSTQLRSALGKWEGIYARLTLAFHLIEMADARASGAGQALRFVVEPETARRAAAYMRDILLPHLFRAYTVMSTTQSEHARWIAGHILSKKAERLTMREIVQAYHPLRAPERAAERDSVMQSLVVAGWLDPEQQANPSKSPAAWRVNPKVHELFAEHAEAERKRREAAKADIAAAAAQRRKWQEAAD